RGEAAPVFLMRQRAEIEAAISGEPAKAVVLRAPANARDHFFDGVGFFAQGKFGTDDTHAIASFRKAVAEKVDHGAAEFLLGYCLHKTGRYDVAVEHFRGAEARMALDFRPPFYAGVAFELLLKREAAEECYSRALALDPSNGLAYRGRGIARSEQGKDREAESDFSAALIHQVSPVQILS